MYPSLGGQHMFITGGGSGIGASIVEAFANVGSLVTFVDIDIKRLMALANRFDNVTFESCDIRNIETLRSVIEKSIEAKGPIAVLVNNAASDDRHTIESVTPEYWDNCQNINLRPSFLHCTGCCRRYEDNWWWIDHQPVFQLLPSESRWYAWILGIQSSHRWFNQCARKRSRSP